MISSSFSAPNGFRGIGPCSPILLDVVCRVDLCFPAMVGYVDGGEDSAAGEAAENQTPNG